MIVGDILSALQSVLLFVLVSPAVAQNHDAAASLVFACDLAAASPGDAQRRVGIAGVPKSKFDPRAALAACEAAAAVAPDDPRIMFQLGRAHAHVKAYDSAREQFSRASDLGYAAAQANLGVFYAAGLGGLAMDDQEALRLFKLAGTQGDAFGNNNLGFFYESGRGGLPKDDGEAARFYKLAADKGEPWGQYNLGRFYQAGRGGLTQNDQEAARLYRLAADQGHEAAQVQVGSFYETGRGGLPKDDLEAVAFYKRAADQGNAAGRNNLGRFYFNGRGGLPQSDQEAVRLYQLAAEQGYAIAQTNLAFFYETGRGGLPQDDVEAARLYGRAADKGEPIGQNKLATFYEEGRGGLPKDAREAARLYKLAAEQDRNLNVKQRASEALTRLGLASPAASPSAPSAVRSALSVIGFLDTSAPSASGINAFRSALKEAGYVEGKNVAVEFRWATNRDEMYELAADMVRRRVDIIVASGDALAARAAKAATDTIPIVIAGGTDPVQIGLVASLNRPGGNVTGVTYFTTSLPASGSRSFSTSCPMRPRSDIWSVSMVVGSKIRKASQSPHEALGERWSLSNAAVTPISKLPSKSFPNVKRVASLSVRFRVQPTIATKSSHWRRATRSRQYTRNPSMLIRAA
jgi:TPR repeat protein